MPSYSNSLPLLAADILFEDLRTVASALAPGVTPADPIVYGPAGSVRVRGFDGGAITESMDFVVQLPNAYKEGSDIHPHVHWAATTNNAGDVKWNIDYYWQNVEDAIPVLDTISAVTAASGAAWRLQESSFANISGAGKRVGSVLICRLWRDPTDLQDTYPDDAALVSVDFHYEVDSAGTRQHEVK
jgi:hypothetical protein